MISSSQISESRYVDTLKFPSSRVGALSVSGSAQVAQSLIQCEPSRLDLGRMLHQRSGEDVAGEGRSGLTSHSEHLDLWPLSGPLTSHRLSGRNGNLPADFTGDPMQ